MEIVPTTVLQFGRSDVAICQNDSSFKKHERNPQGVASEEELVVGFAEFPPLTYFFKSKSCYRMIPQRVSLQSEIRRETRQEVTKTQNSQMKATTEIIAQHERAKMNNDADSALLQSAEIKELIPVVVIKSDPSA